MLAIGSTAECIRCGSPILSRPWSGGIEFASPPGTPRAKPGTVFFLHAEPKKEWLGWAPKIPIAPEK